MTRNMASAKAAGTKMESLVAEFLAFRLADDRIERRAKSGAKDRGDIGGVRLPSGGKVVIECKDTKRDNLPAWIREAEIERGNDDAVIGVVVHKRRGSANPADQFVSMTLETFATLLEGGVRATECGPSIDACAQRFASLALPSLQKRPDLLAHRDVAFRAGWNAAKGIRP